mmetsp:Transcript_36804/g.93006  ORF Transcript_36804/g.93006 Transcript_36804/m.93006 type:complete len:200 (+) Transcript_36804:386-985(+)
MIRCAATVAAGRHARATRIFRPIVPIRKPARQTRLPGQATRWIRHRTPLSGASRSCQPPFSPLSSPAWTCLPPRPPALPALRSEAWPPRRCGAATAALRVGMPSSTRGTLTAPRRKCGCWRRLRCVCGSRRVSRKVHHYAPQIMTSGISCTAASTSEQQRTPPSPSGWCPCCAAAVGSSWAAASLASQTMMTARTPRRR